MRSRTGVMLTVAATALTMTGTASGHAAKPTPVGAAHTPGVTAPCPKSNGKPNFYAPGKGKTVALTFDDGPGTSTQQELDILMHYGVRATFFNIGEQIPEHPDLVTEELADGQTLGDHTWNHHDLSQMDAADQASEIDKVTAAQEKLTGTRPCLLRPPYGTYNSTTERLLARQHYQLWMWSVDTEDWKAEGSSSAYWVNRVRSRAEAGVSQQHPVILMHNEAGAPDAATVAALPSIIRFYRAHGYAFVDVLGHRGFTPYAPTGAAAPAIATTTSGRRVFSVSSSDHLMMSKQRQSGWTKPTSLGTEVITGVSVAATAPTHLLIAATDARHHVLVRDFDHGSFAGPWHDLGGRVAGRPAVAVDPGSGTVVVTVRRTDGTVAVREQRAGRWRGWSDLGGSFVTSPAVVATSDGGLTVAAATRNGTLEVAHDSSGWSRWTAVSGTVSADPALVATSNGSQLVLVDRSMTGVIRVRVGDATGSTWHRWHALQSRIFATGAQAVADGNGVDLVATRTDQVVNLGRVSGIGTGTTFAGWTALP